MKRTLKLDYFNTKIYTKYKEFFLSDIFLTMLSFFIPLLATIISFSKAVKYNRLKYYFILTLSLSVQAYYWDPSLRGSLYDLVRWHINYNNIVTNGFFEYLFQVGLFKPVPILIMGILSIFNNPALLQSVVSLLTIGLILIVAQKKLRDATVRERLVLLLLLLSYIRYLFVISNLWNDLALSIVIFTFNMDFKKYIKNLLYIFSILIHPSVIIIIIAIILSKLTTNIKKSIVYLYLCLFLMYILFPTVAKYLYSLTNSNLINNLLIRYNAYQPKLFTNLDSWSVRHYTIEYTKLIFILCISIANYFIYKDISKSFNDPMFKSGIVLLSIVLPGSLIFPLLLRFNTIFFIFFIKNFLKIKRTIEVKIKCKNPVKYRIFVTSISIFIFAHLLYQVNGLFHAGYFTKLVTIYK